MHVSAGQERTFTLLQLLLAELAQQHPNALNASKQPLLIVKRFKLIPLVYY
jgi:hypothetical protein